MSITHDPIGPRIGVEVHGVDPARPPSAEDAREIMSLLERFGVVVFRGLGVDDAQQVALARSLGTIAPAYRGKPERAPAFPELQSISLDPERSVAASYLRGSMFWHIDGTTMDVPPMASILSGREIPPEGAGTEFCNTYAAYEALTSDEQVEIDALQVVHSIEASQRTYEPDPTPEQVAGWRRLKPRELPLVWTHRSGRKSLVLGNTTERIVGLDETASRALIDRLTSWATRPEFIYRHAWRPGDVVMWDNRGTMHRAVPYEVTARRFMRRVELEGEESIA